MESSGVPLSPRQVQDLWIQCAAASSHQSTDILESTGAMALALLDRVDNPLAPIPDRPYRPGQPVLHAVLRALVAQCPPADLDAAPTPAAVSWDASDPWDPGILDLPSRTRLALWLVRAGADPWQEHDGQDALDLAFQANDRTLVAALFRHPRAPSLDQIHCRSAIIAGRRIPWLAHAAHHGRTGLMGDLLARGFDPFQPDGSGAPAAGWVRDAPTLRFLLEHGPDPTPDQAVAISRAWAQHMAHKLVDSRFKLDQCQHLLQDAAPLDPSAARAVQAAQDMEAMLAAKPEKNSIYLGKQWAGGAPGPGNNAALRQWMVDNATARHTVRAGTARGTWSPFAAALWAGLRHGEGTASNGAENAARGVLETVLEMDGPTRLALLAEPIRPGLTHRQFLAWGTATVSSPAQREVLAGTCDPDVFATLVLGAVESLASARSSSAWLAVLARGASAALAADQDLALRLQGAHAPAWAHRHRQVCGLSLPPLLKEATALLTASARILQELPASSLVEPSHQQVLDVALELMGYENSQLQSLPHRAYANALAQAQCLAWKDIAPVLAARPGDWVLPEAFPFEPDCLARTQGMPTPDEWKALRRSSELGKNLAAATPAPSRPRPRV